jgi:murein DD-endopeptidase MepM/ murein hydrolase activator NlpD
MNTESLPTRREQRARERSRPSRSLPAQREPRRRPAGRPLAHVGRSLIALAIVPAFAVGLTVPANALLPREGALVAANQGGPQADGQRVEVGDSVQVAPVDTEEYSYAKVPTTGSYAQTAATFVNYLGDVQWPFRSGVPISTDFGPRVAPCAGCSSFHKGIDMNPGVNSPVQAIASGVVREVSGADNGGLGVYAVIDHNVNGEFVSSVYAHMTEGSLAVSPGDVVDVGDHVGDVGNTGQSTGPHLHFEILLGGVTPIDPYAWLTERVVP